MPMIEPLVAWSSVTIVGTSSGALLFLLIQRVHPRYRIEFLELEFIRVLFFVFECVNCVAFTHALCVAFANQSDEFIL